MDKIPAALQHKIDYINALDIPVESKVNRIEIATLDYDTYCSKEFGDHFKGTAFEGVASFLDGRAKTTKSKWEKEQVHIEAWRENVRREFTPHEQALKACSESIKNIPAPSKPLFIEGPSALSRFLWAGEFGICAAISFVIGVIFGSSL